MSYASHNRQIPHQSGDHLTRTTQSLRQEDVERQWCLIDAEGLVVGRLASIVANRLRGKHLPQYTPHVDCGDAIVVINARSVAFTGKKYYEKVYFRHTGYPGGIKGNSAQQILEGAHPARVLKKAVERMLGDGSLARTQLGHLHIYPGPYHPHDGQQPRFLDVSALNPKNAARGGIMAKNPGIVKELEEVLDRRLHPLEARIATQFKELADAMRKNADETHQILRQLREKANDDERRFAAAEIDAAEGRKATQALVAAIQTLADRLEPK